MKQASSPPPHRHLLYALGRRRWHLPDQRAMRYRQRTCTQSCCGGGARRRGQRQGGREQECFQNGH